MAEVTSADVLFFPIDEMALEVKTVDSFDSLVVRNVVCEVDFPRISFLTVVFSKVAEDASADVVFFPKDDMALVVGGQ